MKSTTDNKDTEVFSGRALYNRTDQNSIVVYTAQRCFCFFFVQFFTVSDSFPLFLSVSFPLFLYLSLFLLSLSLSLSIFSSLFLPIIPPLSHYSQYSLSPLSLFLCLLFFLFLSLSLSFFLFFHLSPSLWR